MDGFVLTVERTIQASPELIFDVLADPSKHSLIDGSGMFQGAKEEVSQRVGAKNSIPSPRPGGTHG